MFLQWGWGKELCLAHIHKKDTLKYLAQIKGLSSK